MLDSATAYRRIWGAAPTTVAAARRRPCGPARSRPPTAQSASSGGSSSGGAQPEQPAAAAAAAATAMPEIGPQEPFVPKRRANGTFQKVERVPCPQLQAWLEAEQGLPAKQAADAAWQLSLAFQSEQAALAGLPAAFAFCRGQQLSGPEAAAVLCHIARFRRENVVQFASHVQPVWLLLDTFFAAYVKERRQLCKRLPAHLTLGSMMCSNSASAQALVMPPGHVQRWLDAARTRLSAADLGAVVAKQPEVVTAVPEKSVATMDWAVHVLGVPDLARLVRGMPLLLQIETDTLQRKLGTVADALGVPEAQARLLVLKLPTLLGLYSSEAMQDAVAWLRRYFPTTEALWPLLLRGPNLLATSTDKLQRNADYLRAPPFGWDDQRLAAYIWQFPQGFSNGDFRSEKTEPKLLFLSEVVGVSRVDMIAVYPNYLKYSLPTMAAAYVLVREHAPEELVYEDGGVSLLFVQGRAEDLARWCGLAVEAAREHLREWPRRGEGRPLLDELRQGSVAGWKPYLRQLDERAQVLRQARSQLDSSGTVAVAKRRRRRRQPDPPADGGEC